ncbi:AAA family ATPase [Propioniciclava sp.]|uniref:MinD/ParA family ATP-binding protein n=1 Tax=Propioniciclava sp. TaxID=2038686 RepID=UPI002622B46A|nr:AAA family ATPase [Propioniciclava sp.]
MDIEATTARDGSAIVTIDGTPQKITATTLEDARAQVVAIAQERAATAGESATLTASDPDGVWTVIVTPDGDLHDPAEAAAAATAAPIYDSPTPRVAGPHTQAHTPPRAADSPIAHLPSRREVQGRHSFLKATEIEQPATQGWRGVATRLGLRMNPSQQERAERDDIHAVSQHWPGPRTIIVANGKGGAGKTPTTVLLAAVFARYGGAGVVAWDANQTRGTLGWRTEQGPHEATVLDLLPQTERLLGTGAQSADLAHYVHHQTADRFDVLRSQPIQLAADQRVTPHDVDLIWNVVAKYYRLIFIDTGNDESDPVWLEAIEHADQIVVPTTTRADHAEAGALLLDALRGRDQHSRQLADNAVAVVTQADPRASKTDIINIVTGYDELAREVVTIPHDPAIVDGILQWDSLRPSTQRAWLRAAAAVARGL